MNQVRLFKLDSLTLLHQINRFKFKKLPRELVDVDIAIEFF